MDEENQPPPLHGPPPLPNTDKARPGLFALQLVIGLVVGTAISSLVWIAGWDRIMDKGYDAVVFVVPAVKLIGGIILLCFRGYRGFGAGILISIALGFLIFFGTCAAHMNMH